MVIDRFATRGVTVTQSGPGRDTVDIPPETGAASLFTLGALSRIRCSRARKFSPMLNPLRPVKNTDLREIKPSLID
jgi:hypothetical protein